MLRKHEQVAHWTCMRDFLPLSPRSSSDGWGETRNSWPWWNVCSSIIVRSEIMRCLESEEQSKLFQGKALASARGKLLDRSLGCCLGNAWSMASNSWNLSCENLFTQCVMCSESSAPFKHVLRRTRRRERGRRIALSCLRQACAHSRQISKRHNNEAIEISSSRSPVC